MRQLIDVRLLVIGLVLATASTAPAGTIRALLVGIGDYQEATGFSPLEGPPNDLKLMREWIVEGLGADPEAVAVLRDKQATSKGIQEAFQRHLVAPSQPEDVVIFYFSGHGTQVHDLGPVRDERDEEDEALVTADFREEDTSTWFTDDMIHRHLSAVKAGHVLVMFDCCNAGTATREIKGSSGLFGWTSRSVAKPDTSLREKSAPEHHLYLAACGDGELARQVYDKQARGTVGVLTRSFLRVANGPSAAAPLDELQSALRDDVHQTVQNLNEHFKQRPVVDSARRDYALKDFLAGTVFVREGETARPAPGVLDGFTSAGAIGVTLATDRQVYRWTENLTATVQVDRTAYVRVVHVDSRGIMTQLHPNAKFPQRMLQPGETLQLPPREAGPKGTYALRVTGPHQGLEALIAVASTRPFTDREAQEFAEGLFNPLPDSSPARVMHRGIEIEPRHEGGAAPVDNPAAAPPHPDFGQAVRIYRTSQF